MNRRRNLIIVAVGLVALILIGAIASRGRKNEVAVHEFTAKYATFQTKLPETGTLQLPQLDALPAYVGGNVGKIYVKAGDRVAQGQLLATIDNEQIVTNLSGAAASAASARGKADSVAETNAVLPEQNRAAVLQAQANLVAAKSQLTQAQSDLVSGSESGLGYGGTTAEEQRIGADATVSKASTDLREAKRTYEADQYIYEQKGISNDALMQAKARFEQAQVTYDQAAGERRILGGTLQRTAQLLRDRVKSAQDAVAQAEAALASARANAAQSKAGDLQAAKGDADRAQADLDFARDQSSKLSIRAPFDGIVLSAATEPTDSLRPLQPGDQITPGQTMFTIARTDQFVVRTRVDEQDVANLKLGQHAIVGGEDLGTTKLGGSVVAIAPLAQKADDPSNTSRQVVTTIALDKGLPFLRDGMTVDVDIYTHDEPHVLAIPSDAIHKDDKGQFVYVVRDSKSHRVAIKTGAQNDTQTIVTSGVAEGDVVVVDKTADVDEGTPVKAAPSPTPGPSGASPEPT